MHVQGLIFRPNARYSCSTIFAAGEGKHLANASLPLWARTERETRILVAKTRWMNSLSLSLSFDPPQFSLGVEAFKGFVHFAFNWTSCGRDFDFVSAMMVDFRVWRILGDANSYRYRE